jgi:N-acyl-D-amino-acid deacylase
MKDAQIWSAENADKSAESVMGRSMSERDIETFAQWPHINISSDGGFQGHPRGYGTFPRVFANYVRGSRVLSVEKAVESMTSRAALHMGFTDRGIIQPGFKADLVLFDPETMQDHAGIRDGQVLSSGVEKVWVNGLLVLDRGEPTGARSGQVLRR